MLVDPQSLTPCGITQLDLGQPAQISGSPEHPDGLMPVIAQIEVPVVVSAAGSYLVRQFIDDVLVAESPFRVVATTAVSDEPSS